MGDNMEWIILFILNWIIFLLLVDLKSFNTNMLAGFFAVSIAIMTDFFNIIIQHRYIINNPVINILGSSLFFLMGPVFVIGTLISQYHPKNRCMSVFNVIVITGSYSFTEYILVLNGSVEYINWDFVDSVMVNIGAMIIISWFSIVILNKWRDEK